MGLERQIRILAGLGKESQYQGIKDLAGIAAPDKYLYDWPELGTTEIDEETMRRRNRERDPHSDYIDSWGSGQKETSAGSMSDLPSLKKRFGNNIVFCDGINSHRVLPHGSVEDVRQEVRRVMQILGPGGACMIGAVHTMMNDVPPENILAMVDTVEEFGHYPLG